MFALVCASPIVITAMSVSGYVSERLVDAAMRVNNTAGGGAYKLESWKPGQEIIYVRNDDWKSGKAPKIRRIVQTGRSTFYCPVCQS